MAERDNHAAYGVPPAVFATFFGMVAATVRVDGTPAVVFENGVRKPGALPAAQVEQLLVAAAKKS